MRIKNYIVCRRGPQQQLVVPGPGSGKGRHSRAMVLEGINPFQCVLCGPCSRRGDARRGVGHPGPPCLTAVFQLMVVQVESRVLPPG